MELKEINNNVQMTKWVIAHNNEDIFHPMMIEPGQSLITGLPYLEEFSTDSEMSERLDFLSKGTIFWNSEEPTN